MIYLYAVTEPETQAPRHDGLEDQPLALLTAGEVAGLYSQHDRSDFEPEAEVLWRHDQVVEAAMSGGPVLPARFGTMFDDLPALAASLQLNESQLRRQLERVQGCVELAVRVVLPEAPSSVPRHGGEYVRTKLARRRERRDLVEQTLVPLSAHALQSRSAAADGEPTELTASYLVRAGEVDQFAETVRLLAQGHAELSLSCTGPWPPYSFAEEEA